jgi:gamma-glutamylcyclotransferase (GGCT)/AIG2-like uncharacterized protein YtfP
MKNDLLYFAYGSNLNAADLTRWCEKKGCRYPLGDKFANGYLPDMELVFNYASPDREGGVQNIKRRLGQALPGVLFKMPPGGWAALDKREGSPVIYKKLQMTALTEDGQAHDAVTYQVDYNLTEGGFVPPDFDYLCVVKEGLAVHGIDERMLKAASKGKEPPWFIDRLFVYGTLMAGESRHHLLESWGKPCADGKAKAPGLLLDSGKGYPCMTPANQSNHVVTGELYELKDVRGAFEMLDIVEGVRGYESRIALFRRAIVHVTATDGSSCPAWVYLYDLNIQGLPHIVSGNWRNR